jgi:hypothetical protein
MTGSFADGDPPGVLVRVLSVRHIVPTFRVPERGKAFGSPFRLWPASHVHSIHPSSSAGPAQRSSRAKNGDLSNWEPDQAGSEDWGIVRES